MSLLHREIAGSGTGSPAIDRRRLSWVDCGRRASRVRDRSVLAQSLRPRSGELRDATLTEAADSDVGMIGFWHSLRLYRAGTWRRNRSASSMAAGARNGNLRGD